MTRESATADVPRHSGGHLGWRRQVQNHEFAGVPMEQEKLLRFSVGPNPDSCKFFDPGRYRPVTVVLPPTCIRLRIRRLSVKVVHIEAPCQGVLSIRKPAVATAGFSVGLLIALVVLLPFSLVLFLRIDVHVSLTMRASQNLFIHLSFFDH